MTEKRIPKLSKRLAAAAEFAREGREVLDIGTDHAYLPIYLCANGICPRATAADVREGPLARARENISLYGLLEKISLKLTDGLCGLCREGELDIYILGMGGELISRIISSSPWVRREDIRLILQPMTKPELLREYLVREGFEIKNEKIVLDDKLYQIMVAQYSGNVSEYSACELLFGKINIEKKGELYFELLEKTKRIYLERQRGKAVCQASDSEEREMLLAIEKLLEKKN